MSAGIRRLLMCSSSAMALKAAMPVQPAEPDGWYGAVDAGYRTYGYSS